jgi:hypothetical protein
VVEDVDSRHHRLSPEDSRHSPLLEKGPSHPHNRLVAPLDDVVLLRAVQCEFSRREFAAVVGAQHTQLAAALRLRSGLRAPDGVRSLSLAAKYHNPHVVGEVVDEQQEVASSSHYSWCHWATQVPVHELEPLLCSKVQLLEKGEPPLLRQHADVTKLLHVVLCSEARLLGKGEPPLLCHHTDVAELLHVVKVR